MGKIKKFRIHVNGVDHVVEVEELGGAISTPAAAPVIVAAPVATPVSAPVAAAPIAAPSGGQTVSAPMPGNILKVNVTQGQTVQTGDVLCVLEAMKMENEIMAPCNGTVTQVYVGKGTIVDTDTPLVTIG